MIEKFNFVPNMIGQQGYNLSERGYTGPTLALTFEAANRSASGDLSDMQTDMTEDGRTSEASVTLGGRIIGRVLRLG